MSEDVELEEVIRAGIESRLIDLHTAMPGRVESYNAQANTVTVTPVLSRQLPTDDGDYVAEDLPQIPDVKVQFPRAGGFAITFPIQKGDYVLLVFCEASLAAWRQNGAQGDPGDPERHTLSGAVAIPGVFPDQQNLTSPSTSNMVLGKMDTPAAQVEITPSGVNLGAGATEPVMTRADFLQFLFSWANAAVGTVDGGALMRTNTLAALVTAGWPAPAATSPPGLGSTTVRAKR